MITMEQMVISVARWIQTNVLLISLALYLVKAPPVRFLFITFEQSMDLLKTPHNVREACCFTNLQQPMRIHY